MDADERIRRDAVRRALADEPVADVARALGRTERWVFKWLSRYDPTTEDWATARSRAPHTSPSRTKSKIEALVLRVRARLQRNPWAQVGAAAIAWELEKLRLRQLPELGTIERIRALGRRAAARAPGVRCAAKGTPYPAPPAPRPNAIQEADLVGPRHLAGGDPVLCLQRQGRRPPRGGLRAL